MYQSPFLSIITICLNDKSGLEKTIKSVKNQSFRDFEHIIIDGGSVDGSCELLEYYKDSLSYTISEKDNGRYDAMNKGIKVSKGNLLFFLNSGDYLLEDTVLEKIFSDQDFPDIRYGNVWFEDANGLRTLQKQPEYLNLNFLMNDTILHPSAIIRKELFLKSGLYNINYTIASDYDFFLKMLVKENAKAQYIDIDISVFNTLGISTNKKYKDVSDKEREKIQEEIIPPLFLSYYKEQELEKRSFGFLLIEKGKKNSLIGFLLKVVNKLADLLVRL